MKRLGLHPTWISSLGILLAMVGIFPFCSDQSVDDWITLIDNSKGNREPIIQAIIIEKTELGFGDKISITVLADDSDGDTLQYQYCAYELETDENNEPILESSGSYALVHDEDNVPYSMGTFEVDGASASYKAPSDRVADVLLRIMVSDAKSNGDPKGGYDVEERFLSIRNHAPVVNTFLITASNVYLGDEIPLYFLGSDSDGDAITYTISCNKSGTFSLPSELSLSSLEEDILSATDDSGSPILTEEEQILVSDAYIEGETSYTLSSNLSNSQTNQIQEIFKKVGYANTGLITDSGNRMTFSDFQTWGDLKFKLELTDQKGNYTFAFLNATVLPPIGEPEYFGSLVSFSQMPFQSPVNGWFSGFWGSILHYSSNPETGDFTWEFVPTDYYFQIPLTRISFVGEENPWFLSYENIYTYDGVSINELPQKPSLSFVNGSFDYFTDIEMVSEQEVWVSSRFNGIFKFDGTQWVSEKMVSAYIPKLIDNGSLEVFNIEMVNSKLGYALALYSQYNLESIGQYAGDGSSSGRDTSQIYYTVVFRYNGLEWVDQRNQIEGSSKEHIELTVAEMYLIDNNVGMIYTPASHIDYNSGEIYNLNTSCASWKNDSWPPVQKRPFSNGNVAGVFSFLGSVAVFGGIEIDLTTGIKSTIILRYLYSSDTWESISTTNLPSSIQIRDVDLINSESLFICTDKGTFYHYEDEAWTQQEVLIDREEVTKIVPHRLTMLSPDEGWCFASAILTKGRDPIYIVLKYDSKTNAWFEYNN